MIIIKIYTYNIYNRSFLKFVQLIILIKDSRIPNQKQKNQNEILTKKKTRHEINNLIKLNWINTDTGLYGIKHIFLITTMRNFFPSYNLNKNMRSWNMYRNYYLTLNELQGVFHKFHQLQRFGNFLRPKELDSQYEEKVLPL